MPDQVDVRSVEALEALEETLGRAQNGVEAFLVAARAQISTVLDWVTEREHEAQRNISQAEDRMAWAQDGLSDCANSSYDDEEEDPPDCSSWEEQISDTQRELDEAAKRLEEVRRIADQVRGAAEDFLHSARELGGVSDERMRLARLYLQAKTRELHSYLAVNHSAAPTSATTWGQPAATPITSLSSTGPTTAGSDRSRFAEKGIVAINVADIPDGEIGPLSVSDFRKYSYDEMLEGARRFDSDVRPAVEAGSGRDYFQQKDREAGSDYEHGLERLYDAYYGSEPIRVTRLKSGRMEVTNGRHRLFVAKQAGIPTVPASMAEEAGES